jgi:two-component system CheB/CheR fusion protein
MNQLDVSIDDLTNVMAHVVSPLVIVGTDLRMRRFSASAERVLNLVPADIGRPVAYLNAILSGAGVDQVISDVINTLRTRALPVRSNARAEYTMIMVPYRTADNAIRGVVIELVQASAVPGPDLLGQEARGA